MNLKEYVGNMQEIFLKYLLINYWRSVDKKILMCFLILFFLGLFFSFSSTSSLAGERLNKDYYFFFYKASSIHVFSLDYNDFNFNFKNRDTC